MSAKNVQSDTSRVVVKNPLLSGIAGSIDDFVNNSILLPAAEIPATVLPPTLTECHEPDNRGNELKYTLTTNYKSFSSIFFFFFIFCG